MWGKLKLHCKFTTLLFAVGFIEFIIVALYLSVNLTQPSYLPKMQTQSYAVFGIKMDRPLPVEVKQPTFSELFKEESGSEKRLPKLLHDYFRETQQDTFSSAELVGLLNFELAQVKQYTLRKDALVLHINPQNLSSDEGVKSISITKELLQNELKEIYRDTGTTVRVANPDYEITSQPKPGNVIDPQEKMLSLTFDDGPDGNTHALLDALDRYEANATFFVLGQKVAGGVGVLQRMIRDGHEIGNHSWNHPDLRRLPAEQVHSQIVDTQSAIKNATGVAPTLMRPPYGATNPAIEAAIRSQGLHQAMWSIDSNDWRDKDAELLCQRIMTSAADGKVILLHDIHASSVEAAVRAIPDLKAQGYQLVTMSQIEALR